MVNRCKGITIGSGGGIISGVLIAIYFTAHPVFTNLYMDINVTCGGLETMVFQNQAQH